MDIDLDQYNFELPTELIAQTPADQREGSRLLVYNRATAELIDDYFYNIANYLPKNTAIIGNNTLVQPARIKIGKTEIFIVQSLSTNTANCMVFPGKKFSLGKIIGFNDDLSVEVLNILPNGQRLLKFTPDLESIAWNKFRQIPLPPYIKYNPELANRYQTVYAKTGHSLAAPTAGLHFSKQLIDELKAKGYSFDYINLNVGLGTFAPLKQENIIDKKLHRENYTIPESVVNIIKSSPSVTAIGTTTLRALESSYADNGMLLAHDNAQTEIFITNGHQFRVVNHLVTNFHLPKSSLLMLIAAFIGSVDKTQEIYQHAIDSKYRFYSFGDAMLII